MCATGVGPDFVGKLCGASPARCVRILANCERLCRLGYNELLVESGDSAPLVTARQLAGEPQNKLDPHTREAIKEFVALHSREEPESKVRVATDPSMNGVRAMFRAFGEQEGMHLAQHTTFCGCASSPACTWRIVQRTQHALAAWPPSRARAISVRSI